MPRKAPRPGLDEPLPGPEDRDALPSTARLESALARAFELFDAERYAEALDALAIADRFLPRDDPWLEGADRIAAEAWNVRGLCLRALGRLDEALAAFDRATAFGAYDNGVLNAVNLCLERLDRPEEALARADAHWKRPLLDQETVFYLLLYRGLAAVRLGDRALAEAHFREIAGRWGKKHRKRIARAVAELTELVEKRIEGRLAQQALDWVQARARKREPAP